MIKNILRQCFSCWVSWSTQFPPPFHELLSQTRKKQSTHRDEEILVRAISCLAHAVNQLLKMKKTNKVHEVIFDRLGLGMQENLTTQRRRSPFLWEQEQHLYHPHGNSISFFIFYFINMGRDHHHKFHFNPMDVHEWWSEKEEHQS